MSHIARGYMEAYLAQSSTGTMPLLGETIENILKVSRLVLCENGRREGIEPPQVESTQITVSV